MQYAGYAQHEKRPSLGALGLLFASGSRSLTEHHPAVNQGSRLEKHSRVGLGTHVAAFLARAVFLDGALSTTTTNTIIAAIAAMIALAVLTMMSATAAGATGCLVVMPLAPVATMATVTSVVTVLPHRRVTIARVVVADAAMTTRMGGGLLLSAQQSDSDEREKDRDTKN